jgi:hypothetical protein
MTLQSVLSTCALAAMVSACQRTPDEQPALGDDTGSADTHAVVSSGTVPLHPGDSATVDWACNPNMGSLQKALNLGRQPTGCYAKFQIALSMLDKIEAWAQTWSQQQDPPVDDVFVGLDGSALTADARVETNDLVLVFRKSTSQWKMTTIGFPGGGNWASQPSIVLNDPRDVGTTNTEKFSYQPVLLSPPNVNGQVIVQDLKGVEAFDPLTVNLQLSWETTYAPN